MDVGEILKPRAHATKARSSCKRRNGDEKGGKDRDDPVKYFNRFGVLEDDMEVETLDICFKIAIWKFFILRCDNESLCYAVGQSGLNAGFEGLHCAEDVPRTSWV